MPKNYCIMQIWAESGKSALPICNYSQILYQFLTFTQNLKRSQKLRENKKQITSYRFFYDNEGEKLTNQAFHPCFIYNSYCQVCPEQGISDFPVQSAT